MNSLNGASIYAYSDSDIIYLLELFDILGCSIVINNSRFFNNTVIQKGGAIFAENCDVLITNSEFINNTASIGGAIFADV